uniref:Tyrosine-protein kinase receptor n=1 Tax=Phallusia mammillata TaxID=59560 RepID=A0A6F9DQL7_9ASCI|nr:insulin receptor [Phallusia mammillata]
MHVQLKQVVWFIWLINVHSIAQKNDSNLLGHNLKEEADFPEEGFDFLGDDVWKVFYEGPVCEVIDIRGGPAYFEDLQNCTIVNGFLRILLMNEDGFNDGSKTTFPTFPKLRVIVDYLLIYRVYGLKSINQLFPNLVMIGGRNLLYQKYAMVVYENPDLTEIGLNSLSHIKRGTVRIQNNGNLCYLKTIDWALLGKYYKNTEIKNTDVLDNKQDCIDQCSKTEKKCLFEDKNSIRRPYCWGLGLCQARPCPHDCPNACNQTSCVCHPQCLGGCYSSNNASSCFACQKYYFEGTCVDECPNGTLLAYGWQCIYPDACDFVEFVHHNGHCLKHCPHQHKKVKNGTSLICVKCQGECNKICRFTEESFEVTNFESLQMIQKCTVIEGQLILSLSGGSSVDVDNKLEEALGELQVVDSLVIRRSFPIVSLSFFKNLHKITGKEEYLYSQGNEKYSLFVVDNYNLKELWNLGKRPGVANFSIDGGKAFFHFNPHLCLDKIYQVSNLTKAVEDPKDISTTTNGDRVACDVEEMNITSASVFKHTLRITWQNPNIKDYRTLIGFHVYYKKSATKNATYSTGISACGQSSWSIKDVKKAGEQNGDEATCTDTVIKNLVPFTQYAFYVTTSTTTTARTEAQSKIHYVVTPPNDPSVPRDVTVTANNQSTILIEWKEPQHPNGRITYYTIRWKQEVEQGIELVKKIDMCSKGTFVHQPEIRVPPKEQTNQVVSEGTCQCPNSPGIQKTSEEERIETQKFEDFLIDTLVGSAQIDPQISVESKDVFSLSRKRRSTNTSSVNPQTTVFNTSLPDTGQVDPQYMWKEIKTRWNNFTLTGLKHFTEYSFEIKACNHGNYCSPASISTRRTKKSILVDKIPGGIVTDLRKPENRSIKFEAPLEPNGFIKFYQIEVERTSDGTKQNKCCSAMYFAQHLHCELPNDLKKGDHKARVLPVSLAGPGEWSEPVYFPISSPSNPVWQTSIYISVFVVAFLIFLGGGIAFWWFKRRQNQTKHQIYASVNPEYSSIGVYEPDEYEIPAENIELLKEIGHGHFGKVYEGLAKEVVMGQAETQVAVKTLHGNDTISKRMEFLKEASVMKSFNSHHVVRLLGVVSITNKPMVVMEFMAHGDLKTFLRSTRPDAEEKQEEPLNLQQKLQMCGEIADGMAYLSETKFVHRDLAARNCLVHADMTVKIGDFGLTRDVYETDYYRIDSRGILPVRWMAPESLKDGVFDSRSDVWSFGIVLWEIATLAEQPYQGLQHDQVTRYVIDGGYMEQPKECPKKIYDLMQLCWHYSPSMRPTFSEIVSILSPDLSEGFREVSFYHERKEPTEERPAEDEALLPESVKTTDSDMYSSLVATVDIHGEGDTLPFNDSQNTELSAFRHLNGIHQKDFSSSDQPDQANGKEESVRYVTDSTTHRKSSTIC